MDIFSENPFQKTLEEISRRKKKEKGDKFERMVKEFFKNDATWRNRFENVWLWDEWPSRGRRPDTGIDIVAKNANDNGYTAIQCKFYPSGNPITMKPVAVFIATAGVHIPNAPSFTKKILISIGGRLTKNAKEILNQKPPVELLGIDDLENSSIDWDQFDPCNPTHIVQLPLKPPTQNKNQKNH